MLTTTEAQTLTDDLAKLTRITRALGNVLKMHDDMQHHAQQAEAIANALAKINQTLTARFHTTTRHAGRIDPDLASCNDLAIETAARR